MSFWKRKKYCQYCGSELKSDGSCSNERCIAYVGEKEAKDEGANKE